MSHLLGEPPDVTGKSQRRGEDRSTGTLGSESVATSGWSDCPSALSYRSGANQLIASALGYEESTDELRQHTPSSCTPEKLLAHRLHQSMDCGGSWKGFRSVNGGEFEQRMREIACFHVTPSRHPLRSSDKSRRDSRPATEQCHVFQQAK